MDSPLSKNPEAMIIRPGYGAGQVRLGMWACRVRAVLGQASPEHCDDGNANHMLCYPGLCLRFGSCTTDGPRWFAKLVEIEIRRLNAILFGRPLREWDELSLVAELELRGHVRMRSVKEFLSFEFPKLEAAFDDHGTIEWVRI